MPMRFLVTGAQGFLGRYLVARLLEDLETTGILGLGRSSARPGYFTHQVHWRKRRVQAPLPAGLRPIDEDRRYRYVPVDLLDRPTLIAELRSFRPDVVFHFAASLRDESPDRLARNNVGATLSLFEAIAGSSTRRPLVVLSSSGAVYGPPVSLPIQEDQRCHPQDFYSISKHASEEVAQVLAQRNGIPLVIARIFNPVGPGQEERHICGWLARQIADFERDGSDPVLEVGPLDTTRDFVDPRDVAEQAYLLARRGVAGTVYNSASGEERRTGTLLSILLEESTLAVEPTIRRLPSRKDDIARVVADMSRLRALGWERNYPIRQSLGELMRWYREDVAAEAARSRPGSYGGGCSDAQLTLDTTRRSHCPITIEPGLLDKLPDILRLNHPGCTFALLSDERVHDLYGRKLGADIRIQGGDVFDIVVPEGEVSKSLDNFRTVIERMNLGGFQRRSVLLCLGGGMITDLGGFVASSYMRGVPYICIPTTLLAQHDSAVGGKVAVNALWSKNFIGAFHHPAAVFSDPCVLATLEERFLCGGIAEAVKVAMTGAVDLFEFLEETVEPVLDGRDPECMARIVRLAVKRKIELLQPDPYEADLRRVLNLGHTFGHPLETVMAYRGLSHGEAVGYGLAVATAVAYNRGDCTRADAERILDLLRAYHLPPEVPAEKLELVEERMREVRMIRAGRLNFVYPTGIGQLRIVSDLEPGEIRQALAFLANRTSAPER